jgi:hypothetical protein
VVDRIDDCQQIHGDVDLAGNPRNLWRLQLAACVYPVGNDKDCPVPIRAVADEPGRLCNRIKQRRSCPTASLPASRDAGEQGPT